MTQMPRMKGAVTGNFGKAKVKAGSTLNDIGVTNADVVKITPVGEYNRRLVQAYYRTDNDKLKKFIIEQLHEHHTRVGTFEKRL